MTPAEHDPFELAVEAVIDGNKDELDALLSAHSGLARARSRREHRATLLHYVAANGVEDERQRTPPNAVAIGRTLLGAGADVDACCEAYGGGDGTTPLCQTVTSAHPALAGVQEELTRLLLDTGAALNGLAGDGKPLTWALAFGYTGSADVLFGRGAVPRDVVSAAGANDRERLEAAFDRDGRLKPEEQRFSDLAFHTLDAEDEVLGWAFVYACMHGRLEIAEWLADRGAPLGAHGYQGFTPLHHAAWHGREDVLEFLLARKAPLDELNAYGGTVLDGTLHASLHSPVPGVDYERILARLVAAR